ncbi:MAG: hypothetical protein JXA00_01715 [Candidatus Thermoplasmatota archaeon]|nr:hypothetical protein [Candidatus Thermoplasmatota archaeon]
MAEKESKKKEDLEQLRNAEKKFQSLIERRNELNQIAVQFRDERDMLHQKRKELKEEMDTVKKERETLVTKMKEHKEKRNQYQLQAKQLIDAKRKKKGDVVKNLPLRFEEIKADIQIMEYEQETTIMNTRKENKLIDRIKEKRKELAEVKKQMDKQQLIEVDLSDTDKAITELFQKADKEHEKVQQYYQESQQKHEAYKKLVVEIATLIGEANKKHKKYLEVREEAQSNHEKASEMRSKIISVKKERMMRFKESKEILRNQNLKARKELMDTEKLDKVADQSVEALKGGKKITLSG